MNQIRYIFIPQSPSKNKFNKLKIKYFPTFSKSMKFCLLGWFFVMNFSLFAQMKLSSVLPLNDRPSMNSNFENSVVLDNDSSGLVYLNYISGDTLMLRRKSETIDQRYFLVLKGFDMENGLEHCLVKKNNRIFVLNRVNNTLHSFDFEGHGSVVKCKKLSETKIQLSKKEKLIRIEKDQRNVYLVSYDFQRRFQKFYLLNSETNAVKLLYSQYNPFVEIFFSDPNVSNYSFYNNKLALTNFYTGNTLIVDLMNSHVDTVKLPYSLNKKSPSYNNLNQLSNQYNKHPTWANYDSLMNLVYNYNHIANVYFFNDSTIVMIFRFKDMNSAPFNMMGVHLRTQRTIFTQKSHPKRSVSEIVTQQNMPIYLGFETSNYIGDGVIYVYKKMPELNKYDSREFYNKMNDQFFNKTGTFLLYKFEAD